MIVVGVAGLGNEAVVSVECTTAAGGMSKGTEYEIAGIVGKSLREGFENRPE